MDKLGVNNFFDGFYAGKKVFITGHTGFKGSWLSILLHLSGAKIYGYALEPPTNPSLFDIAEISNIVNSTIADIRNYPLLLETLQREKPEIIIHMAAQPLVRESYRNPRETYEINVMGTVNLFEAARHVPDIKAILNVTTDKCYENKEWHWGYRENEPMGGFDPYSNSKGCSELVTSAFRSSFFNPKNSKSTALVASARAGNVIGGGDWATDRLIPDFVQAILNGQKLRIRSQYAIRPWQYVLEPLNGYLMLCRQLITGGPVFADSWNFGPDDRDAKNVEWITEKICSLWGEGATYEIDASPQPHEATYLKLDCSKAKTLLGWQPRWPVEKALENIVGWTKAFIQNKNMYECCVSQIIDYYSLH